MASLGALYNRGGGEVVFNLGQSLQAKVSSMICQGDWRWPRIRNRVTQTIINYTTPNFRLDCAKEDSIVWLPHSSIVTLSNLHGRPLELDSPLKLGQKWFGMVDMFFDGLLCFGWLCKIS